MKSDDENVQFGAVHKFRTLLSQDCLRVEDVEEQGAIQLFIQFLKKSDKPKLQSEAAWCCSAIAGGSSTDTKAVVDAGIIPLLSQLLHQSKDENVLQNTLDAISNIACDCVAYRDMCLNENILQQVIKIIESNPDTLILRSAASAISSLCGGNHQPLQVSKAALPVISKLLNHSDDDAVESACWAASYLSQGDNTRIQAILDHNMVDQLVALLQHQKSRIQSPALKTVGNIVTGDDKQTQAVVDAGALPILKNLLKHKQFRQEAAWTISNITAGNAVQVKAVIDSDIVPPLIHILRSNCEWDVKKEAGWAIANATEHASDEHIRYLVKMKCVKPLCELISCMDEQLIAAVLGGLKNILVSGHKLRSHGEKLVYARQIYEAGGVDAIISLKRKTRKKDIRRTIESIEMFYDIEDAADDDHNESGVSSPSSSSMDDHQHDQNDISVHHHHHMDSHHSSAQASDDESTTSSSLEILEEFELPFLPKHKFVIRQSRPGKKQHESEAEKRFRRAKLRREQLTKQVGGKKGQVTTKGKGKKKGKASGNALADKIARQLKARKQDTHPPSHSSSKKETRNSRPVGETLTFSSVAGGTDKQNKSKGISPPQPSSPPRARSDIEPSPNSTSTSQSEVRNRKKRNGREQSSARDKQQQQDRRNKKRINSRSDSAKESRTVRFPVTENTEPRKSPPSRNNIIGSDDRGMYAKNFSGKPPRKVKPLELPPASPSVVKPVLKSQELPARKEPLVKKPPQSAETAPRKMNPSTSRIAAPRVATSKSPPPTSAMHEETPAEAGNVSLPPTNAWKTPFVEALKKDDTTTTASKPKDSEKRLTLNTAPAEESSSSSTTTGSSVASRTLGEPTPTNSAADTNNHTASVISSTNSSSPTWGQSHPILPPQYSGGLPATSNDMPSNGTSPLLNLSNVNLRELGGSASVYSSQPNQGSLSSGGGSGQNKSPLHSAPNLSQNRVDNGNAMTNNQSQQQPWNPVYQVFGTHLLNPNLSSAPHPYHSVPMGSHHSLGGHGMAPMMNGHPPGPLPRSSDALRGIPTMGSFPTKNGGGEFAVENGGNTYHLFSGHHDVMRDSQQNHTWNPLMQWQTYQPPFLPPHRPQSTGHQTSPHQNGGSDEQQG